MDPNAAAAPAAEPNAPAAPVQVTRTIADLKAEAKAKLEGAPAPAAPAKAEPEKEAPKTPDLLAVLRADKERAEREAKLREKEQEIERKAKETEEIRPIVERVRKAAELKAKGDKLGYLRALAGDEDEELISEDLFWEVMKRYGEGAGEGERKPAAKAEDIEAIVKRTLEAERAREKEERETRERQERDAREKALDETRTTYVSKVAQAFTASADKYPHVREIGINGAQVIQYVEANGGAEKVTPEQALDYFESRFATAAARARGGHGATITPEMRSDPGRPLPVEGRRTLEQEREAIRRKLDES